MTLTQLKYILAVERCHNFAQAARECFVTQPTLSMQIAKLEDYLQVIIFDRSASPTKPTALGKKVLEMAREVIHRSDALEELARSVRQEVAGEFSLAVIPTLAPYLLPHFVEKFRQSWPKVQLRLFEHQTDEIAAMLREDKLDAGILATPLELKDIKEDVLFHEGFQLLFSPGHPLLKEKEVREQDLKIEEAWLLKEGHCLRSQVLQLCRPAKVLVDRGVFFEGGSIETLVNLLESMPGFTVVPELAIPHLSKDIQKRLRPLKGKRPVREISLVTGPFALKASITMALKKTLLEALPVGVENSKKDRVLDISG
jgi:LysR family transcriptional regulator, hydrogen peroxide-inducible genes activator